MRVIKYLYHYGLWAVVRRCFDRAYRPRGMGLGMMIRLGVHRVGTLWAIPTLKSWRVWKVLRRAKRVRIFLTVPEWWGGGAVYYLNQQISGFERGCVSLVVSPAGFARCLTVRVYDGPEMVARFYVNGLAALKTVARPESAPYRGTNPARSSSAPYRGAIDRRVCAEKKMAEWLTGVDDESFEAALERFVSTGIAEGAIQLRNGSERELIVGGAREFFVEFARKVIRLSDSRCVYFVPDPRSKARGITNSQAWAEYAVHAVTNGGALIPGKEYHTRWFNHRKVENFDLISSTLLAERCAPVLRGNPIADSIKFFGETHDGGDFDVVVRLDEYGNANANMTEVTFEASKVKKRFPRLKPLSEAVEAVVCHQAAGTNPSTVVDSIANPRGDDKGGGEENKVGSVLAETTADVEKVEKVGRGGQRMVGLGCSRRDAASTGANPARSSSAPYRVEDIVVSTVVAWHDVVGKARIDHEGIAELMRQILDLKHALGCKLLYLLHDYYCVCPRLFLVGDDGQYCRSEFNGEKCKACCAADVNCADQIAGGTDVMKWRWTMEGFLSEAEEIRAFCADTVWRMQRVFPQFSYTLVPHPEPTAIRRKPVVRYDEMHVGLVGNIGQNKGVDTVAVLSAWLRENHRSERLTIIGNWCSARPCPDNVETTGSYRQEDLPELVERTGVNVVLFTSTVPETFSYVMHEIMQLGLPVVSFDRGAQKDCAEGYEMGRVIPSLEPTNIWQTLGELYEDVRQSKSTGKFA